MKIDTKRRNRVHSRKIPSNVFGKEVNGNGGLAASAKSGLPAGFKNHSCSSGHIDD